MNKIANSAKIKNDVVIGENVIIEENVWIDHNCIIRDNVHIKKNTKVGAMCILGEYLSDFYDDMTNNTHSLTVGENSLIRSHSIIYGDTSLGDNFQSGHRVVIREESQIGNNTRIGTGCDIQGYCRIGNYVNLHSNVQVNHHSIIKDYAWLFPYVVLTNDPTPPSNELIGPIIEEYAVICAYSVILPGVRIGKDAVVGASSNVTRDVKDGSIVVGNPAKKVGEACNVINKITGKQVYPWYLSFERGMPWEGIGYENWSKE